MTAIQRFIGSALVTAVLAFALTWLGNSFDVGLLFLLGCALLSLHSRFVDWGTLRSNNTFLLALATCLGLIIQLLAIHYITSSARGWRAFEHLSDLPTQHWAYWGAILPIVIGSWLWSLRHLVRLQKLLANRSRRLPVLLAAVATLSLLGLLPFFEIGLATLFLSLLIYVMSLDIYLESERTSMTWLLVWWLLLGFINAGVAFRNAQAIDTQQHATIAEDVVRLGYPDTLRKYHLSFAWDTLSYATVREQAIPFPPELSAGQGQLYLSAGRQDWLLHRSDGQGYVLVGRTQSGLRPMLLLGAVLLLFGLLFTLALRWWVGLMNYPYQRWLLPLFGPNSLRVRIQLAFFVIVLVTFLLVGWFTVRFFQEESTVLEEWGEQLIGVYAFLLLIAGVVGIFIANSISAPIVEIGERLRQTRLQDNEPLRWERDDEIGQLVAGYNRMINELDESVLQLAEAEREGAWREMARQVAHEIKNPLTPMKLQLQQLIRLEQDDPERALEWRQRVAGALVAQIDVLANIATAFSEFARLPELVPSRFDLRELLQASYDLHRAGNADVEYELEVPTTSAIVFADRNQLLRVLNNLLRNAEQALAGTEKPRVRISLQSVEGYHQFSVIDNGPGVEEQVQHRIFQPNFTTKSSGMGLGLAMCRSIVEQSGGRIDFVSRVGETQFFVRLPKADS